MKGEKKKQIWRIIERNRSDTDFCDTWGFFEYRNQAELIRGFLRAKFGRKFEVIKAKLTLCPKIKREKIRD